MKNHDNSNLEAEAWAFDERINARVEKGFVPDLQRLEKNHYFYKSFWREPLYARLYVGEMFSNYLKFFDDNLTKPSRILDVGCGPGYFSLELARHGYDVVGVDISKDCIRVAEETLESANLGSNFGSLKYFCKSAHRLSDLGVFDGILSSGFLHHCEDLELMVGVLSTILDEAGVLVLHEPQHKKFGINDAAFVTVVRQILALCDRWYEQPQNLQNRQQLSKAIKATHIEYVEERDPQEDGGQSPNDLAADYDEISEALKTKFNLIEEKASKCFTYRTIGGLRGRKENTASIARFLDLVDQTLVEKSLLNANYLYSVWRN